MRYPGFLNQIVFAALLALFAVAQATAQEVDDVVRTDISLVQLHIGVVDKQGRAVTSLTQRARKLPAARSLCKPMSASCEGAGCMA